MTHNTIPIKNVPAIFFIQNMPFNPLGITIHELYFDIHLVGRLKYDGYLTN
ncbi:MAG: hypothetical protein GWN30_19945 [Gammaproteobacteria bacterium]|nr:hypothetical protein [Gammaproteobacteria bacterium]